MLRSLVCLLLLPLATTAQPPRGGGVPEGRLAPDFNLKLLQAKDATGEAVKTVKLSSFREVKPVVLIFGSYT